MFSGAAGSRAPRGASLRICSAEGCTACRSSHLAAPPSIVRAQLGWV